MNILSLLASSSFITVNKDLIKAVGIEAALLFGELASEYSYWSDQNDDYFYSTVENLEEKTTLNDYQQRKAIKVLKDKGLIEVKIKGVPAKRYFKINDNAVLKIFDIQFFKNLSTGSEKIKEQDLEIFQGNNNINNNNIKKEYNINIDVFESEFEEIWKTYPRKEGKTNALKAYIKARTDKKDPVSMEDVQNGLQAYIEYIKAEGTPTQYIKHGSTWFNQRCWNDEYTSSKATQEYHTPTEADYDFSDWYK